MMIVMMVLVVVIIVLMMITMMVGGGDDYHDDIDDDGWMMMDDWGRMINLFFFFLFVSIPFIYLRPSFSFSLLLIVVTLIRGHMAGSSPPLPTTVRALQFYREKKSAHNSLVDSSRRCAGSDWHRTPMGALLFNVFLSIMYTRYHTARNCGGRLGSSYFQTEWFLACFLCPLMEEGAGRIEYRGAYEGQRRA